MHDDRPVPSRRRFHLRTLVICLAFIALFFGWYKSILRERTVRYALLQKQANAQLQKTVIESRASLRDYNPAVSRSKIKGVLSNARLEGVDLRGAMIDGGNSAFQRTVFDHSNLGNASLIGGHGSFQGASFNYTNLQNAKLAGGAGSFQLATFEGADLSGAELTGNLQGVSLANANCTGITISGSFQGAAIDAAQFQHADLSAIASTDLATCYYDAPPTYDANTKFPDGFDPSSHGWKKIPESSR